MDRKRALLVDAFTEQPLAGNAAGVVPDAAGLATEQMQAIARELGASDTAFLLPSESVDRRARYFTPATEVDLCGHATIASYAHLLADGVIDPGDHRLETAVGDLDVTVEADGTVWMTQADPAVREVDVAIDRVASVLGLEPSVVTVEDLPIARATTGLAVLVVPVRLLEHLGGIEPDGPAIEALSAETDTVGIYAFTFDTLGADATLHGRMFAPGAGIAEDPVTGTASGATGAYLRHVGAFDSFPEELLFEQGHFVDRPGQVRVRVGEAVQVGGRAVVSLDGELSITQIAADDIIEG